MRYPQDPADGGYGRFVSDDGRSCRWRGRLDDDVRAYGRGGWLGDGEDYAEAVWRALVTGRPPLDATAIPSRTASPPPGGSASAPRR